MSDRVSISTAAWQEIDKLLAELPYRLAAPIVQKLVDGGVRPIDEHGASEAPKPGDETGRIDHA
jgi:hypothetical protein